MTPTTLSSERREKFRKIVVGSTLYSYAKRLHDEYSVEPNLDEEVSEIVEALVLAARSRTEIQAEEPTYAEKVLDSYSKVNDKDKVLEWLKMSQYPGANKAIRVDNILSYCAVTLGRVTTSKEWEQFAKWIDDRQQKDGQKVETFVAWLMGQKGYDPQYWPIKKMQEFWPQAFVGIAQKTDVTYDKDGAPESW